MYPYLVFICSFCVFSSYPCLIFLSGVIPSPCSNQILSYHFKYHSSCPKRFINFGFISRIVNYIEELIRNFLLIFIALTKWELLPYFSSVPGNSRMRHFTTDLKPTVCFGRNSIVNFFVFDKILRLNPGTCSNNTIYRGTEDEVTIYHIYIYIYIYSSIFIIASRIPHVTYTFWRVL
jgi:hypothetical protein